MKKFILSVVCALAAIFSSGCADMAKIGGEDGVSDDLWSDNIALVAEAAAPAEEGYYMVEGSLGDMGRDVLSLETKEGQILYFKLSPETIIYTGEDRKLILGQAVKVVFDLGEAGEKTGKLSVIAVAPVEGDF